MPQAPATGASADAHSARRPQTYAALDLGTNNCRLLIATPSRNGFRIVEAFSRIVRLGEGLSRTGELQPEAMDRAVAALKICADKIERRQVLRTRAVATQACRSARNGPDFIARVRRETGLDLTIIPPDEEARLAVAGCASLLDPTARAALVVDVGGGSTELCWVRLHGVRGERVRHEVCAWHSIPLGVVTLSEEFPEPANDRPAWYESMVARVEAEIAAFQGAEPLRDLFSHEDRHLIGTSGAITSLAGLHLGLNRYDRSRVDGLWLGVQDCRLAAERLIALGPEGRAAEPCIGRDRADLVLAGAAILEAVQRRWPCPRVRVADRGLREGMLQALMRPRRRHRRRRRTV